MAWRALKSMSKPPLLWTMWRDMRLRSLPQRWAYFKPKTALQTTSLRSMTCFEINDICRLKFRVFLRECVFNFSIFIHSFYEPLGCPLVCAPAEKCPSPMTKTNFCFRGNCARMCWKSHALVWLEKRISIKISRLSCQKSFFLKLPNIPPWSTYSINKLSSLLYQQTKTTFEAS